MFLDKRQPAYIGGLLEMATNASIRSGKILTKALRTGEPQNEAAVGEDFFAALYSDEDRLELFLRAMQGIQQGPFHGARRMHRPVERKRPV